ncbi:esterase-like activity of phytase family protein [Actinoplanes sp. TBRC 11911]|uniref:esterase-like activity of phytase family protein n=1 Tax=Actinoplanes sp. TBRC 11911 TaxID=2729386 RepID=UPI00145C41A4|nr:esterase-like activity of phytase family protein [Actinoplanes sp. TBRC 11911]NMO57848.1 esterase-like activity of phytase family protein [Actinoplanes sp. TBRC 11911]
MSTLDVAPRLLGEFVVPRDLPIGGTSVGSLSGRDRRSGRYLTIGGHRSPRRALAREIELDERTGNLVWSYDCRPEDETMVVDWECLSATDEAPDDKTRHSEGGEEPAPDARPAEPHANAAPGRAYRELMGLDEARCHLGENHGHSAGAVFLDAGDVDALRSAPVRSISPVRRTLLPDLAEAGVPDPDNMQGLTWRPGRPSGRRTLLLVSGNDVMRELRAPAIPPKPL